jgi:hypothetical protein
LFFGAYGEPGATALTVAADLATDFRVGVQVSDTATGIVDSAGDGQWRYLSSDTPNPQATGGDTSLLTWDKIGDILHDGYGGGKNGHNLPAVSNRFAFASGNGNIGIQGRPGYHELTLHPAGIADDAPFTGEAPEPYVVARWLSGPSSVGLANVSGSIRNLVDHGDSVDFHIYVDGILEFEAMGSGSILPETYFDFDVTLQEGSIVDFVLGNGAEDNLFGDESLLRAVISVAGSQVVIPEPSGLVLAALGLLGLLAHTRQRSAA